MPPRTFLRAQLSPFVMMRLGCLGPHLHPLYPRMGHTLAAPSLDVMAPLVQAQLGAMDPEQVARFVWACHMSQYAPEALVGAFVKHEAGRTRAPFSGGSQGGRCDKTGC
jgi:hypothetical protein